jgi:hypothetical protein
VDAKQRKDPVIISTGHVRAGIKRVSETRLAHRCEGSPGRERTGKLLQ